MISCVAGIQGGVDALRKAISSKNSTRRGVPRGDLKASTELIAVALKNSIADDRGRWVLGPHLIARNEHRIRARNLEGTHTYIVDRMFSDAGGETWIVDYKTSQHEGGEVERFLDREVVRYSAKLNKYRDVTSGSNAALIFRF
jgi:hypothetical protein